MFADSHAEHDISSRAKVIRQFPCDKITDFLPELGVFTSVSKIHVVALLAAVTTDDCQYSRSVWIFPSLISSTAQMRGSFLPSRGAAASAGVVGANSTMATFSVACRCFTSNRSSGNAFA